MEIAEDLVDPPLTHWMLRLSSIVMMRPGRIHNRVITRVLRSRSTRSRVTHRDVGDLQKAVTRLHGRYRTHNDIVQQRLTAFALQRQQCVQGVGQDARAAARNESSMTSGRRV